MGEDTVCDNDDSNDDQEEDDYCDSDEENNREVHIQLGLIIRQ